MKKPHKHAELIKAWADGAEIEYWDSFEKDWLAPCGGVPTWGDCNTYRIKPEPVEYILKVVQGAQFTNGVYFQAGKPNLKLTFDGETGQLKSAEVLK